MIAAASIVWKTHADFLYPLFLADLTTAFLTCPFTFEAYDGYRTWGDQEALWTRGRRGGERALAPGRSPHNFGCAVHLKPVEDPADYRSPAWNWVTSRFPGQPVGDARIVHGRGRNRWHHFEWSRWASWKR